MKSWIGTEHVTATRSLSEKTDFSVWNVEWPALSPDLSYLDFYSFGHLKIGVYQDNFQTVIELKEAIEKEMTIIGSEVT